MLAAVLLALAQSPCGPAGPVFCGGESLAAFEFAPLSGRGMGAACACTTPTGAKGETLTFVRASSATCLRGGTLSGIENGDLVTCATNQPRVGRGGDGTGPLKLLVENTSTNYLLRSQEFDNAAWVKEGFPTTVVVTADQATAPDGTLTAERIQSAATSGTDYSDFYQSNAVSSVNDPFTCSALVKGNASADTTDLCAYNGASWSCASCSFVAASWTRCTKSVTGSGTSTTRFCKLGNNSNQNGGIARNATDFFAWGLQGEVQTYATSYIATAGATVTRAAESATFPDPGAAVLTTGSAAASILTPGTNVGGHGVMCLNANGRLIYLAGGSARLYDGTNNPAISVGTLSATVLKRFASDWGGSTTNVRNITDGTSTAGSFDGDMTYSAFTIGTGCSALTLDGWIGQVCLDPDRTRCR